MIKSYFVPLRRLREEVRQLKQSVEAVTHASPEKLVEQILAYASRRCWRRCITRPLTVIMTGRTTIGSFISRMFTVPLFFRGFSRPVRFDGAAAILVCKSEYDLGRVSKLPRGGERSWEAAGKIGRL